MKRITITYEYPAKVKTVEIAGFREGAEMPS
jgi:hypothetical protein